MRLELPPIQVSQTLNELTVVEFLGCDRHGKKWLVQCSCGTQKILPECNLRKAKSCGCVLRKKSAERAIARNTTHGASRHKLYTHYTGMMTRCYNPNTHAQVVKNYQERGIEVCREWKDNPSAFIAWAETQTHAGEPGYSLDRYPDNNGPYAPDNCRFATSKEQNANKRPRVVRVADCHPDRKHCARGLCKPCYYRMKAKNLVESSDG